MNATNDQTAWVMTEYFRRLVARGVPEDLAYEQAGSLFK